MLRRGKAVRDGFVQDWSLMDRCGSHGELCQAEGVLGWTGLAVKARRGKDS